MPSIRLQRRLSARLGLLILFLVGLAEYGVPAICAPTVRLTDSEVDLELARRGVGIFKQPTAEDLRFAGVHAVKPGFITFLAFARLLIPGDEARSVVVLQSLLLFGSIAGTALYVRSRGRPGLALAIYCLLLVTLRLRDAASAVMSEAITLALFIPAIAVALFPPRGRGKAVLVGFALALLFLVRGNVGAIAIMVLLGSWVFAKVGVSRLALAVGTAAVLVALSSGLTRSRHDEDPSRGLAGVTLLGSADYCWPASFGGWPQVSPSKELARAEIRLTVDRWRQFFATRGPDKRRQLVWRLFHGLFGTEYYDLRWSHWYAWASFWSRVVTPFVTAYAVVVLLAALATKDRRLGIVGLVVFVLAVVQNLLLGSLPRFVLPLLPGVWIPAMAVARWRRPSALLVAGTAVALFSLKANRQVLDWEWGVIEGSTVIRQPVNVASRADGHAVLHVRIFSPVVPASVATKISGPDGEPFEPCTEALAGQPVASFVVPAKYVRDGTLAYLDVAGAGAGTLSDAQFLMFPVVPVPWGRPAHRIGQAGLSPSTRVFLGSLDWWVHPGSCAADQAYESLPAGVDATIPQTTAR